MAEVPTAETATIGPIRRARASLAALETLDRLRQNPHIPATPEDLAALRGWSGWGPLAPALEHSRTGSWKQIGERIAVLLPEQDYDHGVQATYNAFYTPPEITAACWKILTSLGFTGGRILEPGCGAGGFIAATPAEIPATWIGVERDPTTAAIASLLHPHATIHARRLEETPIASYAADALLGNVPFGDTKVYDPTTPRELTANLHNYFIYRSLKALRPGGVAVLITSRYTMDAASEAAQSARTLISREAELLGAIRLPNDTLTSGGTEPLVDVLVLRRRRADEEFHPDHHQWITTGPSVGGQQVNAYFLANPRMVLGELAEDSAPRWGRTLRVDARPEDPPVEVAMAAAGREIVRRATEAGRGWRVDAGASPITAESAPFKLRADGKKEGSFHLVDGVVHEVVEGALVAVQRPGKELPKLVALRDAVLTLLDAEADLTRPDEQLAPLRADAARLYDAYVTAHGYLNRYTVVEGKPDEDGAVTSSRRRPSMCGFRRDPDFVTVLAVEDFDDESRTATKAALLTRRVNRPRQRATHADSPAEAIALCRDELGSFDLDHVIELLGVQRADAERQLADVAFIDPVTDAWVPADEYLTGNVRQKLARAKSAAGADAERFGRNVPALQAVIPADLEPEQIEANLGAPWIPASDVQQFARELLGFPVNVWHEPRTNTWSVTAGLRAQESAQATTEWGTVRFNAYQLLEYGLNGKAPVVYDVIDDGKRVRNQDETIAANDRLDAIAARFANWWREEPERADRLTYWYNQTFNAVVPRRHDGTYLTFPGLDSQFEPYPHQRDMVARMISGDDALCPYPVGTGKTATMFMAAIKLKALGLASKPLIIVVPSTLEQIARDGKRLFPHARILMAGKEDLATARARKLFAARCAMEEWDAVVMSHPSFTSLPVHPTVKADYLTGLAADYRSALIQAKADGAEPRKIKQIAKMVDRQEAEAKALLEHATDDGVFFEHLGVDYLLVDEMHYFKNLDVPVHTDGFAINGSKRAQDLDMKLGQLRARHPSQAVVTGFTGTPVSNTLLELFILQHYLQPARLEELGLASADAWASLFVRFATGVEITPDGGFRLNRRPVEIINIPELMHTVAEFAELRAPEAFPVVRPDAHRHLVVIDSSDTVRDYVHQLAERADDIRAGGVLPSDDNMLKICSDGRKVALHESLVGLRPEGPGKLGAVAANVARIYHETKNLELPGDSSGVRGRLQLVFCDLGTPNKDKGNQVYGLIRQQLLAAGVPAAGIRFIHEAATDAQRMVLFDHCNKGEVAVLLGSTDKLGVGVNIQRRAAALHHVDAPWRPDQVEQREGRVWRPKNLNPSVDLYRYVTKDSFDAFMWQTLERKEKALRPILAGQVTARTVEDIGDVALDYGQIKAVATGNPMLAELGELNVKAKSLASLAASHQRNQRRLRADVHTLTMQAAAAATNAEALDAVARCAAAPDDSPWLDASLRPLPEDDVPAVLGALAESTLAEGYCDGEVHWRGGLGIDFTYAKNRHDGGLSARIIVADNRHRIDIPLNPAWAAKGQHWRIRDAIATTVGDASQTAAATRGNIQTLHQRIRENEAAIGQPFAEQAALDQVRARQIVLDAAIREQAQKDEQARRNRASRAAASAAGTARDDRDALLRRLHAAMSTMLKRAEANDSVPSAPISVHDVSPAEPVTALANTIEPDVPDEQVIRTDARTVADADAIDASPTTLSTNGIDQSDRARVHPPLSPSQSQGVGVAAEADEAEVVGLVAETPEIVPTALEPSPRVRDEVQDAAEARGSSETRLAATAAESTEVSPEPVAGPVQSIASMPVQREESSELSPIARAHRTSVLRQRWHPPMSAPVDKHGYDAHTVYGAFCKDCEYVGPWHGREQGVLEDTFDHSFPGWRELLPVVAAMNYQETQNKNAYTQWKDTIVELYPAGWLEAGGPVLVARNRGATRWHDDWFLGGNYNVCGVQRAIGLHAPARHKRRTRLVAASYQPHEPLPPASPDGPVGELTDLDTAAALSGIFTPGKLVDLGMALSDKVALRAWLKVRGQDSRDEHVGYRPGAPGQPPTFDTVTETREGLAVVVLTETERREGLIAWRQVADYLRPALTPEAYSHLSGLYEAFQRFYANPQREIEPTLRALHALRGQAAAIHRAAAAAIETKAVVAQSPTAQTAVEAHNVLVAQPSTTAQLPEDSEPALPVPIVQPIESTVLEPSAATQEPDEPVHETQQPQEPDYEQLDAEVLAQKSHSSGQQQLEPEPTAAGHAPTAPAQPAPAPSPIARHRSAQLPSAKERSQMFEQAIDLALQGFALFPLTPGTKRPMFKNWEKRASTDPRQIARWWSTTPNANIAIACGPSNLLVIDLDKAKRPDGPRHGEETLAKLAAGRELPHTFAVASARGGRHLYYRQPDGAALSITTGSDTAGLGPLVDTRGHGGFIVAPGSVFEGGNYRVEHDTAVAPLPAWIADELTKRPPVTGPTAAPAPSRTPVTDRRRAAYGNAALKQSADTVARASEGTRNDTLNRESFRIGRLVGGEILFRNDAVTELRRAAHRAGLPPGEAANTIASGLAAGIGHPRFIPEPTTRPQTSQPTEESAMTTMTDQEPRTPAPTTTKSATEPVNAATNTAQPDAEETAATTANGQEATKMPKRADAPSTAKKSSSSAADSTSSTPHEADTPHDPANPSESEFDFDAIWSGVRASIERARQAIPDWTELNTPDDLKPAIDEALRYLAQTPIPRAAADQTDSTTAPRTTTDPPKLTTGQAEDSAGFGADDLDAHLAAVDAAYAEARASGIPTDRPEWAGISAVHSAVHNLWDTLKAAAGTYWAQLSADIRVRGLLTTLVTRAIRAIANLADTAATRLEQRGTGQKLSTDAREPSLREAYIEARNHVRAHAATHEWQRITALWGTVNTLTRQADDPGIRAVIASSADAISDYADTLSRKTTQYDHTNATDALATLAAAAERHATSLRDQNHQVANPQHHQTPAPPNPSRPPASTPASQQQGTDAQLLQARARQVAQHAQARLNQTPRKAAPAPRHTPSPTTARNQSNPMRTMQPNPTREATNILPR